MAWKNPNRDPETGLLPHQADFIEWLVDPQREGTQNEWARQRDLGSSTLAMWKRTDPHFQAALRKRLVELNLDPLGVQEVIQAMHKEAKAGNVQAAKLVLDYIKYLAPNATEAEGDPSEMSDEELAAALEAVTELRS